MTTHNHQPTTAPELSPEARSLFSISKVNEWRTRQYGILSGLRANSVSVMDTQYVDDFTASIDSTLDDYLAEQGIDSNSPSYTEIRELYRTASVDRISENEWGNSPASRGVDPNDHRSQRDVFAERITARLGTAPSTAPDQDSENEGRPELTDEMLDEAHLENARFDVNGAREQWATASAKRQGRAFSLKDKARDEIRDDYHAKVQKLGILELDGQIADTDDATAKNAKVITFLFDEQKKLRELTTEKLKGTKVGKFVAFMNKGSLAQRIAKGVGLGFIAGGVGAVGGALIGAAGIGAGVAAAVAAGASRFVRGYSSNDRHRGMQTAEEALGANGSEIGTDALDTTVSLTDRLDDIAGTMNDVFEDDTVAEQNKRKKALTWGLGSVAVGAGLGYALGHFTDFHDAVQSRGGKWFGFGNSDVTAQGHGGVSANPETVKSAPPWVTDPDGDGFKGVHDAFPHDPTRHLPTDLKLKNPYFEWHIDADGVQQDNAADVFHDLLGYDTKAVSPEWLGKVARDAGVDWTPGNTLVHQGHLNDPANEQLKKMLEFAHSHNLQP